MNRQNVWTLYDRLVSLRGTIRERRFKMDTWIEAARDETTRETFSDITSDPFQCGSAACLLGWACMIAHSDDPEEYPALNVETEARRWLGLNVNQSNHWAMGHWHPGRRSSACAYSLGLVSLSDALVFLRKVLQEPNDMDAASTVLFTDDLPTWMQDMKDRIHALYVARELELIPTLTYEG